MAARSADVVVVGGGIAGVAAAYELTARGRSVVLVEQEQQLAHHTTGRSAAVFLEAYGPPAVQALTRASRPLYDAAPATLGTEALLDAVFSIVVATGSAAEAMPAYVAAVPSLELLSPAETLALCPVLRPEAVEAAAIERGAANIDVLGLHQGFLRAARQAGLEVVTAWPVTSIAVHTDGFTVTAANGESISCADVVIAAGAWSDGIGELAGARRLGLRPLRRTIAICPTNVQLDPHGPLIHGADESYYWKPEGPNVLCSPADETPSEPCDARPEELDIALALERVNETTTLGLRSVSTAWAGLRTFSADGVPVAGADPHVPGLWWSVGQGGYGIQTAPAMAALLGSLVAAEPLPAGLAAAGVNPADFAPARFA